MGLVDAILLGVLADLLLVFLMLRLDASIAEIFEALW